MEEMRNVKTKKGEVAATLVADPLSFGRIFGYAENRALRGSALTRSGPGCAVAAETKFPQPLQSLARLAPLRGECNPGVAFCTAKRQKQIRRICDGAQYDR
jgi:hypothetical protein